MGITLDERLAVVAQLVRKGSVVADVGTDHGHLACHLVATRKCPRAFACDIAAEPLRRAYKTICKEGLDARILPVQCNGLEGVPPDAVKDVVVAGLGGDTIADIVLAWEGSKDKEKRFVLQPMTKPHNLRRRLYRAGFMLSDEVAVICGKFSYTVMLAQYVDMKMDITTHFEHTGKLWDKDPKDKAVRLYMYWVHRYCLDKAEGYRRKKGQMHRASKYFELAEQIAERFALC